MWIIEGLTKYSDSGIPSKWIAKPVISSLIPTIHLKFNLGGTFICIEREQISKRRDQS